MQEVFVQSPQEAAPIFAGHVELEVITTATGQNAYLPWRLRKQDAPLYQASLFDRSFDAVGVRLNFVSNTTSIVYELDANVPNHRPAEPMKQWTFDLLVDGKLHDRITQPTGRSVLEFTGWSQGEHRFELYLFHISPCMLLSVKIDDDAVATPWVDDRPTWLTYGSSITQSGQSHGPSETWPAIVAQEWNLNHTNLGYGGNANLDPIVARMIADMNTDAISLCFNVNNYGNAYSLRTWRQAAIGFILTIRDKKPNTPILCTSPIWSSLRESQPGTTGMTLTQMRKEIAMAVEALQSLGDRHLHYIDGLSLFDETLTTHMPDGLHPNNQGSHLLAQRFSQLAMPWFANELGWSSQPVAQR